MNKKKFSNFQNPLNQRKQVRESHEVISEPDKIKFIQQYGKASNISSSLLNKIDFNDKEFINRIYDSMDDLYTDEMTDLQESIKSIGLMNTVYLLEKTPTEEGKNFLIVSGLRRLMALNKLSESGNEIREINRVVIFKKDSPKEMLNKLSIDENTKRKDLTLIELSYKLRKDSKIKKVPIEQLLDEHNLNRRKFFRITKLMDYPKELQNIVEEIGVNKAETINKILKINKYDEAVEEIIDRCKDMTERELTAYYKEVAKKDKNIFDIKINAKNNQVTIKIHKKVDDELKALISEFNKKVNALKKTSPTSKK